MMSMPVTRFAFDHASASAVRSSIAAAMVIAELVLYEIVYNFGFGRPSQGIVNKG
jgi:hypothetical protein